MMVDLIVENGRIHTGVPGAPVVSAVAIIGERIVASGQDVDGLQARQRVDAQNRVVLPGFNDAHAHSVWSGMTLIDADPSGVTSLDDLYRVIGDRARDAGPDEWIVAAGFNPVLLQVRFPIATYSIASAADVRCGSSMPPVTPASSTVRVCGVPPRLITSGEAIDGGRIVLDDSGRPNGVLEERAMSFVRDVLLPCPLATIERALDLATAQYAREGLTSVTDAGGRRRLDRKRPQ